MIEYKYKIGDRLSRDGAEYGEIFGIEPGMEGLELMHPHLYWVRFSHGEYPLTEDYLDKEYKLESFWKKESDLKDELKSLKKYINSLGIDPSQIKDGKFIYKPYQSPPALFRVVRFTNNGNMEFGMVIDRDGENVIVSTLSKDYTVPFNHCFYAHDVVYVDITGGAVQNYTTPASVPLWIVDWEDKNNAK